MLDSPEKEEETGIVHQTQRKRKDKQREEERQAEWSRREETLPLLSVMDEKSLTTTMNIENQDLMEKSEEGKTEQKAYLDHQQDLKNNFVG